MNEQKNTQSNESCQCSKNNCLIYILIVVVILVIIGAVCAWQYLSNQNEIDELNQQITQLKEVEVKTIEITDEVESEEALEVTDKETPESTNNDVVDNTKLGGLTRYCSDMFSNYNQPVDETITNTLNSTNKEFKEYIDQGYSLQEICNYTNKNLLFLDFRTGYFGDLGEVSYQELSKLAENVVIGVADSAYNTIDFYPVTVENYRFAGTGSGACNFDKYENDKILYICADASDNGASKRWYVYDLEQEKNIKVKYTYQGRYDSDNDKEELLNSELLKLFTEKE